MRISEVSVRRPVLAVMIVGALVALGAISRSRLGVDLFPRVEFPVVTVNTVLEGANPETIESEVTEIIEAAVNTISGIDELTSQSSEGLSQVFVQFDLGEDIDLKAQDVRDKVALARRDLPVQAEAPIVEKLDPDSAPILAVMVAGPIALRDLTRFADDVVKERLERLPGVGAVTLVGGRDRAVRIWPDLYRLRGHRLSVDDLVESVRREHADLPGGRLEVAGGSAEYGLETQGEVQSVDEFGDIAVARRAGATVYLRDVAWVEDGLEDERSYSELGGVPGVSLLVRRQSGRNSVEVAGLVKAEVAALRSEAPDGIELEIAQDTSRFIETSIHDVTLDMVLGGFLAVVVTLLFLRSWRSTLIVAIAIPTSVVATFFFFFVSGFTVNMLTMMALSVSIGILIDDAIVVLENIYRHIEEGRPPFRAAIDASAEIGPAVIASTLAIGAVFVPIAFMKGIVGRFFYEYGLSVVFAVFMSLLVALTLTPMLCAKWLRRESELHGKVFATVELALEWIERRYRRILSASIARPVWTFALALLATWVGVTIARQVPMEFTSRTDRSEFEARVEMPLGTGLEETKRVARTVAAEIDEIDEVDFVFWTIGSGVEGRVDAADFYVKLVPKRGRASQFEVMARAREALRRAAPQAKTTSVTEVQWISGGGFQSFDIEYAVMGPDLVRLDRYVSSLADALREDPQFVDTNTSYDAGKPEVRAEIDRRRAAALGVSVSQIAGTLNRLVGGVDVTTYEEAGQRYDVRLRLKPDQRDDLDDLKLVQVRAQDGRLVDLENVATLELSTGPVRISRNNRTRQVTVYSNPAPGVALGTAVSELESAVAELGTPEGYGAVLRGSADRMREAASSIVFAFLLALLSLYMILASQFDSFSMPLVVMVTAPLAFIGAFAALWLTGQALSLFAQIGVVILMGLVMKNGILLVDYANQLRAQGKSAKTAMIHAGAVRLRPILMTTVSTVSGMLPVALARTDGAEFRNAMGILVIGGLLSSMFLTLIVIPTLYTVLIAWGGAAKRLMGRLLPDALSERQGPVT